MIPKKSREELLNQILKGIVQETDISMVGSGSVTHSLASVVSTATAEVYQVLDDAVTNSFLPTASGFYLDLFGETFGLPRNGASSARIDTSDRNIKFYVNSGTLAQKLPHPTDLNKGRIPAGTTISTADGVSYSVDRNYDFPAAAKEAWVGAISLSTGSNQNVAAGKLNVVDVASDVLVTNVSPITTGSDVETDDEYRFRISKWVRTSAGRNEMAVRLAVFSASGVADMIKEPYFAGPGSFRLIIIPTGNRLSAETLRSIYSSVSAVVSEGTFFAIEGPRYVPVSISVRLVPVANSTISETDRALAKNAILRYLGDIRPGETLVVNRLRSEILGSSRNISDVSIQGLNINKRPMALVNYRLEKDEVFIPNEDLSNPILVN